MNILDLIRFGKKDDFTNFFDYPAEKRKKIIVRSARRGAELQLDLVKRYEIKYGTR